MNATTLNVATIEQKIAFLMEMQGQISDGQWENASPRNHWEVWGSLNWENVIVDPDNVGRNFYAAKDNYNFTNIELMSIVADRMIVMINLVRDNEEVQKYLSTNYSGSLPDSYADYVILSESEDDYSVKKMTKLTEAGITGDMFKNAEAGKYTRKQLIETLNGLKFCFKTYRSKDNPISMRPVEKESKKSKEIKKALKDLTKGKLLKADEVLLKSPAELQKYTGNPVRTIDGTKIKFDGEGVYLCLSVGGNRVYVKSESYEQLVDFMRSGYVPRYVRESDLA